MAILASSGLTNSIVSASSALRLHVSPDAELAKDDPDAGSEQRPFLTIDYAIKEASRRLEGEPLKEAQIVLLAGTYSDDPGPRKQYFPLVLPGDFHTLELSAKGSLGSVRIQSSNPGEPVFELGADAPDFSPGIVFSALEITGGLEALLVLGSSSQDSRVTIRDCSFEGQIAQCVRVSPAPHAMTALEVTRSTFKGSRGGLYLSAPLGSALSLTVQGCQFLDIGRYSPAQFLGSGIDLYLERRSVIHALVDGCKFRGLASAVQLTDAEDDPESRPVVGELAFDFFNNVVNGLSDPAAPGELLVENAIYLSLRPAHEHKINIVHNTFVGIHGYVLYSDNLEYLGAEGQGTVGYLFANNICRGTGGESEFYDEHFAELWPALGISFPPLDSRIHNNLLEKSSVALELPNAGNILADPDFQDASAFDFRLRAGSPAIDVGSHVHSLLVSVDILGECRRMSVACDPGARYYMADLGAYEYPGFCDDNLAAFVRGDCNSSAGIVDIADAVASFRYLFSGAAEPRCMDACDSNDDGAVNISDGIFTLSFLFSGGPKPPEPYPLANPQDVSRDCLPICK